MPSYTDEYRSRSSRHAEALPSSSYRSRDDRDAYSDSRPRATPGVWRRSDPNAYDRDDRRSTSYRSSSSSEHYAYPEERSSDRRRMEDDGFRSRYSNDYHDEYHEKRHSAYDDNYRSRPRSPYRSSRDLERSDREYYAASRDKDRDRERDRIRTRDVEPDWREHRYHSSSARSRSRERDRPQDRERSQLASRRHSREGGSDDLEAKPALLKRKPMSETNASAHSSSHKSSNGMTAKPTDDEEDKLETMMNASKRLNGAGSTGDSTELLTRQSQAASSETARWREMNGEASSSIKPVQSISTIANDEHYPPERIPHRQASSSVSRAAQLDAPPASQTIHRSFGHVDLAHELPATVREKNSMTSAPYQEGVKVLLRTAKEKGVVDVKTKDPRLGSKKPNRLHRISLHPVRFAWDSNSVGKKPPPPPRTVVLTNLSALTKVGMLLNRFRTFGRIEAHKLEMDPKIGQSLGIFSVTFAHDYDEQGKVLGNVASNLAPQNGAKVAKQAFQALDGAQLDQVKITALLDRAGEVVKEQIKTKMAASAAKLRAPATPTPTTKTPTGMTASDNKAASPLPSPSGAARGSATPASSSRYNMAPPDVPRLSRPSSHLYPSGRPGRYDSPAAAPRSSRYEGTSRDSRDDDRRHARSSYDRNMSSPLSARRSEELDRRRPSYSSLRDDLDSRHYGKENKEDTRAIMSRLLKLKHPYVFISQPRSSDIVTSDIRSSMSQVQPAWISQGDSGWYVAFDDRNGAHGCKIVTETLTVRGYRLSVEVRTPTESESLRRTDTKGTTAPAQTSTKHAVKTDRSTFDTGIAAISKDEMQKTSWTEAELQDAVFRMVQKDLAETFIRDIKSRIVSPHITQYLKPSNEGGRILAKASVKKVATAASTDPFASTRSLDMKSSLPSFRKLVSAKTASHPETSPDIGAKKLSKSKLGSKLLDADERSKKSSASQTKRSGKVRKETMRFDWTDDESDMDEDSTEPEADSRSVSASVEPPSTDGTSVQDLDELALGKTKKGKAAAITKTVVKKGKTAAPAKKPKPTPKVKPIPKLDPFEAGLAEDTEDLLYLKLALERIQLGEPIDEDTYYDEELERQLTEERYEGPAKHQTDSARTEGYYVIPAAQKAIHLLERNKATEKEDESHVLQSARNNRADSRRLVLGFEQHKRETATDTDMFKFNQLRTRKKQLKFAKSPIHDWGLYAMELIPAGDMVIEYVGEMVRQQVADEREKQYERQGNFSTYLFRVDDDLVVDATHKGNIARLMNHCCTPNCNAKILTLNGEKRIVLFAKDPIRAGEELTYDYKFQSSGDDEDAIACLCGSAGCRRFL